MKKKKKVLVVENETPTAMMIVSWLTQIGFDVRVAAKGQEGLETAQERKFDLIILEAELPEIGGFEIFEDLRQRHISYRTPVIFLSDRNEYCERAPSLGANAAIQKPLGAEDLISCVLSALEETEMA